ncbi:hypothetical protein WDW89_22035 [Deltaproteobacteria bacterium TL4]
MSVQSYKDLIVWQKALDLESTDLQEIIGIKHRETFQRNYLNRLLEEGLIVRTIPDKPQSRMQKYIITAKGKELLEKHL